MKNFRNQFLELNLKLESNTNQWFQNFLRRSGFHFHCSTAVTLFQTKSDDTLFRGITVTPIKFSSALSSPSDQPKNMIFYAENRK